MLLQFQYYTSYTVTCIVEIIPNYIYSNYIVPERSFITVREQSYYML